MECKNCRCKSICSQKPESSECYTRLEAYERGVCDFSAQLSNIDFSCLEAIEDRVLIDMSVCAIVDEVKAFLMKSFGRENAKSNEL